MILEEVVREIESPITEFRTLKEGDELPEDSGVISIDQDWIWVAVREGLTQAAIIAVPYHGSVFVGQVLNPSKDDHVLIPLLRKFLSDVTARGYKGLFTFLDNDSSVGKKLESIFKRAEGTIIPTSLMTVVVALPMKRKW